MNAVQAIRLLDALKQRLLNCSADELRVLDVLLKRLEIGRERYGFLDLSKPREWDREEAEEYADAAIYRACGVLAADDRAACEAADDLHRTNPIEHGLRELVENTPADLGGES